MPQRHKDTNPDSYRDHKEQTFNDLYLVRLCVLVPLARTGRYVRAGWWQKKYIRVNSSLNLYLA
jgi:hypothetical protein